jgi:hypothetical protein
MVARGSRTAPYAFHPPLSLSVHWEAVLLDRHIAGRYVLFELEDRYSVDARPSHAHPVTGLPARREFRFPVPTAAPFFSLTTCLF